MKFSRGALVGIAAAATVALFHANEIEGALLGQEAELAGECKVVFVDGEPDHCVIVIPGTNTPVAMPSAR
jgi:hypothetical protein